MSFEVYLRSWLNLSESKVDEATKKEDPQDKKSSEVDDILNIIESGIGGEPSDKTARSTSFESIEQVLQKVDILTLEKIKDNPELQKVLLAMVAPGKVEWMSEYLTKSKKNLSSLSSDKKKTDPSLNFEGYKRFTIREADVKSRIYKMHLIFKYASDLPELDKDTNILLALKQLDSSLNTEEGQPTVKIGKIGRIDNTVNSDEFEVIDQNGESKLMKKAELAGLLEKNPEIAEKAKALANDSYKKKLLKLVQRTEDTIRKEVADSLKETERVISNLPNDVKTMETLQVDWKPLLDALGYSKFFTGPIQAKEKEITKNERPSLRKKNRIKEKLMSALSSSLLPPMTNGEISEPGGDYYKLFKKLEGQNTAWLEAAIREVLVDSARISQFNNSVRTAESSLEENQLAYLQISSSWIIKYIESEVDGELSKRDTDNAISKVKAITQEKEKEIKNYYLSKDFNMKNFKGIQLKPDLRLPLYQRVRLAVSEADRIAESPLKNLLKGLGQIAVGLLSSIPDRGDAAEARKNANQNKAIFNGIFSIIKGGVYGVSKQGGRDFEKGVGKVTNKLRLDAIGLTPYEKGEGPKFYKSAEKKTNEDAVTAPVSPGTGFQTPDSLPTDNMDTFALAGPGKKAKKKKIIRKVSNFNDFLKSKD
jgi:hypothetical protein